MRYRTSDATCQGRAPSSAFEKRAPRGSDAKCGSSASSVWGSGSGVRGAPVGFQTGSRGFSRFDFLKRPSGAASVGIGSGVPASAPPEPLAEEEDAIVSPDVEVPLAPGEPHEAQPTPKSQRMLKGLHMTGISPGGGGGPATRGRCGQLESGKERHGLRQRPPGT